MSFHSENLEHRLQVLEQTLIVTQKEVNSVLGEVQAALQGMTRGTKMALEVFDSRITAQANLIEDLQESIKSLQATSDIVVSVPQAGGREL